jgi:tRNA-binding EMAP/Myf-like protein
MITSGNSKIDEIFKESIQKLNSMIMYLDTQLGTVSLTKEEIELLGGIMNKYKPLLFIDPNIPFNKEEKKTEKKQKNEKNEKNKKKNNKKEEKKENKNNENIKEEKKGKKGLDKNEIFKLCDLRVGNVKSIKIMEGFNDIYELDIDLGEGFIRKIGTGLRHYVPMEKIANSKVIVFSNLKPKRFGKNFESNGMIMCASNKINDKEVIELLRPNENSNPGDKVYLEGTELDNSKVEQITGGYYKKAIELFKTDDNCNCMYNGIKIITQSGNIIVESLKNSQIS